MDDFDRQFRSARRFGIAAFIAILSFKFAVLGGLIWLAAVLLRGFGFL